MATTQERPAELARLARELGALEAAGLLRHRRTLSSAQGARVVVDGVPLLSFCSNDYLGLAADPVLAQALVEGVARHGVGAGASHLLTGHTLAHTELEAALARWCGLPAALLFSSGYMANLGVAGALLGRGDVMFADRLNHACLNDGALLARARLVRYAHADASSLARALERTPARRRLIATDAVFSMDGDLAPLRELLGLAERHDAWLMVDDAHGFGVLGANGEGTLAHHGIAGALGVSPAWRGRLNRLIYMATLGKAAGVAGAFVAGEPSMVEWVMQKARTYMFATAAPAMVAAPLRVALQVMQDEPQRRRHLGALQQRLREGVQAAKLPWALMPSGTAIQPLIIGSNEDALAVMAQLDEQGVWVPAIRPPTVPEGTARLRISLSAAHTLGHIDQLVAALAQAAQVSLTKR